MFFLKWDAPYNLNINFGWSRNRVSGGWHSRIYAWHSRIYGGVPEIIASTFCPNLWIEYLGFKILTKAWQSFVDFHFGTLMNKWHQWLDIVELIFCEMHQEILKGLPLFATFNQININHNYFHYLHFCTRLEEVDCCTEEIYLM